MRCKSALHGALKALYIEELMHTLAERIGKKTRDMEKRMLMVDLEWQER